MSWADRIVMSATTWRMPPMWIVTDEMLPSVVTQRCGTERSGAPGSFISGVGGATLESGTVGMAEPRRGPGGVQQGLQLRAHLHAARLAAPVRGRDPGAGCAGRVLRADRPNAIAPEGEEVLGLEPGGPEAYRAAVTWVGGMTDRYAFDAARTVLGWHSADLPKGL
ncbi:MAG: hypothetical protein R2716_00810 [Microthrixaceae bacterium]